MTRDEFMEEAQKEIDQVLLTHKNRLMNLVMKAWAEGKKNAEMDRVDSFCNDIFDSLKKKLEEDHPRITLDPPSITIPYTPPVINWNVNDIPAGCRNCPNHPSNGGSGICHCIIGTQPIMCNSTAADICDAIAKDKIGDSTLEIMTSIGEYKKAEVYNACCDNHIKIIHDMMTGVKPIDGQE